MLTKYHYHITKACAKRIGIPEEIAERIAFCNAFTDDNTEPMLHGMVTQCPLSIECKWNIREVQDIVAAFHFPPGDGDNPYVCTANSALCIRYMVAALINDSLEEFGEALHTLQDSNTHHNFTGWQEKHNACKGLVGGFIPNIGHSDLLTKPDEMGEVWPDPRTKEVIDNNERFETIFACTWDWLNKYNKSKVVLHLKELNPLWELNSDKARIAWLKEWGGYDTDYKPTKKRIKEIMPAFQRAARKQYAIFNDWMAKICVFKTI